MATARTLSKPSFLSDVHPVSRLKSQVYFFDVPLGYANHTMASPLARFAINGASLIHLALARHKRQPETCLRHRFQVVMDGDHRQLRQHLLKALGSAEHNDFLPGPQVKFFEYACHGFSCYPLLRINLQIPGRKFLTPELRCKPGRAWLSCGTPRDSRTCAGAGDANVRPMKLALAVSNLSAIETR